MAGAMRIKRRASHRLACKLLVLTQAILLVSGCSAFKGYPERATDPSTDLDKLRPDIEASDHRLSQVANGGVSEQDHCGEAVCN